MTVPELIASARHAHEQIESLVLGSAARDKALRENQAALAAQYGGDVDKTVAVACATGAEEDAVHALQKAAIALWQEIEHLESLTAS